jgi:hypothetical protein
MELRTANFAQKLFVKVPRFLLVFVEQLPIAVTRLTRLALIFAFFYRGLFGRLVMRLLVLNKLLVAQEGVPAQLTDERPYVDVFLIMLVDILD